MNKSLRNIFSVVFALLIINTAKSQQPLGLVIGDFNTPYSVSMNPANVASQYRNRAYVNWWGSSLDVQSSFANGNGWNRKPARLTMTQNWTPKSENENWSMNYLNETYGFDLTESDSYDTLAGLILAQLERLPAEGDEVQVNQYKLIIEKMSERRIETIRFYHVDN